LHRPHSFEIIQFLIFLKESLVTLSIVERLANKTWARRLRSAALGLSNAGLLRTAAPAQDTWTWLAKELLGPGALDDPEADRFQGLFNVKSKGTDPRKATRLIRVDASRPRDIPQTSVSLRKPPGRAHKGADSVAVPVAYQQTPIDLVARGELLVSGSGRWVDSPLWRLTELERLPDLEQIRSLIRELLTLHGLCRLPSAWLENSSTIEGFSTGSTSTLERYRRSLAPLICYLNPDSICLLAALSIESFIVGNHELFELQRSLLCRQIENLLSDPNMEDIREEFLRIVAEKLVNMVWEEAPPFSACSIDSPLMPIPPGTVAI
jgi:hypothetical protein